MGEVYKARDTRLDRVVAIKILPDETADLDRKQRFLQEAKAASALNHPSIVTIYDIGSENGVDYIAMEFIDGKPLDQLIPRNGMRLGDLLRDAVQAADALAKAHQAGIVHRDLKPANVMVSSAGLVKVLDFGLAKLTQPAAQEGDATQTLNALTGDGKVVGTTYYMSPEQAEAKPVDGRSDIFSFGAMLYEMATGQRPFVGDSQVAVLSNILRADPKPRGEIRTDLPVELIRIITRCLRKDPERRFQHMADLKVALEELREESDSGSLIHTPSTPYPPARKRPWWWAVAALALAGAAFAAWRWMAPPPTPPAAVYRPIPVTSYPGHQMHATFSPDGNQVAFGWDGPQQDNLDIYVKLIGPGSPLRLTTDPADDGYPEWSPDGRSIAFLRMSKDYSRFAVMLIPALGGPERRIASFSNDTSDVVAKQSLCWTPDSRSLIVSAALSPGVENQLLLVPIDGGEPKPLMQPAKDSLGDSAPSVSPDGRTLAFVRSQGGVSQAVLAPLSSAMTIQGAPRALAIHGTFIDRLAWVLGGRELVTSTGLRAASSLSRISTEPGAEPRGIPGIGLRAWSPAISPRGDRLVYTVGTQDANFWSVDLATKTAAPATTLSSSSRDVFPQFSPDGKRVAFYSDRGGSVQIWTANRDGSQSAMLTSMDGPTTGSPRWSPDGQQILFDSNTGGNYHVYVIPADGGRPRQLTQKYSFSAGWSHDGSSIYFTSSLSGTDQVWKISASGGEAVQVTHGGGFAPTESADGKTLYFTRQDGPGSVWKMPVAGGEETKLFDNLYRYNYALADKGIYYIPHIAADNTTSIQYFNFATGQSTQIVKIPKVTDLGLGLSPDGRTLLYSQVDYTGSNLMLVENFH